MFHLWMIKSLARNLLQKPANKSLQVLGDLSVKDKLSVVLSLVDHLENDGPKRVKITLFLQFIHPLRKHLCLSRVTKIYELDDFRCSCTSNKRKGKIVDSWVAFDERTVEVDKFYALGSNHEVYAAEIAMKDLALSQGLKALKDLQANTHDFCLIQLMASNIVF